MKNGFLASKAMLFLPFLLSIFLCNADMALAHQENSDLTYEEVTREGASDPYARLFIDDIDVTRPHDTHSAESIRLRRSYEISVFSSTAAFAVAESLKNEIESVDMAENFRHSFAPIIVIDFFGENGIVDRTVLANACVGQEVKSGRYFLVSEDLVKALDQAGFMQGVLTARRTQCLSQMARNKSQAHQKNG